MDKKLKMWITVGVVVIVIVGTVILLYSWIPGDPDMYKAEITIDVSQNETAYIINITNLDVYYSKSDELKGHSIEPRHVFLDISRQNNSEIRHWTGRLFKEKSESKGIKWIDIDEDEDIGIGDKIILYKSGGEDYTPQKGDKILLEGTPHYINIESNYIELH